MNRARWPITNSEVRRRSYKSGRFQRVVMISRQPFECRPFLASVTNKLPFILGICGLDGNETVTIFSCHFAKKSEKANLTAFATTTKRQKAARKLTPSMLHIHEKKSTSQSAFFNLRILMGLFITLPPSGAYNSLGMFS